MKAYKRLYKPLCRLPIYWIFAKLGRSAIEFYENRNYDMVSNGEMRLMRILAKFNPTVVFDVGANVGEWSLLVNNIFNDADIYSFEPAPKTFNKLKKSTADLERVRAFPLGLSSSREVVQFHFYEEHSGQSSKYDFGIKESAQLIDVELVDGDSFCQEHGVDHIDFLKIDVEGEDLEVIKGFSNLIDQRKIDIIQFEYGRINIKSRALLINFYEFFEQKGYMIGKVFPYRVDFRPYDLRHENFIGPNYVAVKNDRMDIIRALGVVLDKAPKI